jgi:hypothetical protein
LHILKGAIYAYCQESMEPLSQTINAEIKVPGEISPGVS